MPDNYVVGVDGSDHSKDALQWAVNEAASCGGSVTAVLTWQMPFDGSGFAPSGDIIDGFAGHQQGLLDEVVDRVDTKGLAEQIERVVVASGNPGHVLAERGHDADLLVVGTRGRGGFLGLLLGSVAEYCLHNATCPIALVPAGPLPISDETVVGVDGSPTSVDALRWAVERARHTGGRVTAVYSWNWLDQPEGSEFDANFGEREALAHLEAVVTDAGLSDDRVGVEAINDLPARALIERAAKAKSVVVGSQRQSAIKMVLVGSVARQLAHHTPIPLVVHR